MHIVSCVRLGMVLHGSWFNVRLDHIRGSTGVAGIGVAEISSTGGEVAGEELTRPS